MNRIIERNSALIGTIAYVVAIICLCIVLVGCGKIALKAEQDVADFMKDKTLSTDCKGGIAAASILAPDTSADVRIAAEAVQKYANKDSEEYKACFTKTAFASFAARGGIDEISKIAQSLATLGLIK